MFGLRICGWAGLAGWVAGAGLETTFGNIWVIFACYIRCFCERHPFRLGFGAFFSKSLIFTVFGEGRPRLVQAKCSVASLLTVKLNGFGTFSFQDPLQPPIATLATLMPPDAIPDALKLTVWVLALGSLYHIVLSYIYLYINILIYTNILHTYVYIYMYLLRMLVIHR